LLGIGNPARRSLVPLVRTPFGLGYSVSAFQAVDITPIARALKVRHKGPLSRETIPWSLGDIVPHLQCGAFGYRVDFTPIARALKVRHKGPLSRETIPWSRGDIVPHLQ